VAETNINARAAWRCRLKGNARADEIWWYYCWSAQTAWFTRWMAITHH